MPTAAELKEKFWKSLRHDMTMMIGLDGTRYAHARPMTAQLDKDRDGPIYFFTSTESELAKNIGRGKAATGAFAAKGHDLFATLHGKLSRDRDRATIVGTRTFGKGVFQEVIELSNGGALDITAGQYFTPNGRNLGGQGVKTGTGLKPDVAAKDDPKTVTDEALRTALRTAGGCAVQPAG